MASGVWRLSADMLYDSQHVTQEELMRMGQGPSHGTDHLLQCEMLLMKLTAEQAASKFRDEVKAVEQRAEDKLNEARKENE